MFDKLEIFRMSQSLAQHAAARQSTIAQNVANADTPGYRARDLASFADSYKTSDEGMRATRAKHMMSSAAAPNVAKPETVIRPGAMSPNGNSVSLETEMFAAADAQREHDLALSIYRSSLNIMRASLGRR